jgi:protein-S-isoprenylcysteine O-methyltransferase Ste14
MFVLGRRFSAFVAIQEGHTLVTDGFYRHVRHPSYAGMLLAFLGWSLVFRSSIGVLLFLVAVPLTIARIDAEEALLASEFGGEWAAYRARTWRLVPGIY